MYQTILKVLAILTIANGAQAVGIQSDELTYNCSGVAKIAEIDRLSILPGFSDRAGNFHPASGHATYKVMIDSLSEGCAEMQAFLGIDFQENNLETYQIFSTGNLDILETLAAKVLGQSHNFKAEQKFSYTEQSGYLPFFPLIHKESVSLKSPTASLSGAHFKVNTKKAYDIFLFEEDQIELSEMIFKYLELDKEDSVHPSSLISALFENHPSWEMNFKSFMDKILTLYDEYEVYYNPDKISDSSFVISSFTGNINSLSSENPFSYYLNLPTILTFHPSLLNSSSHQVGKPHCPSLSTIELERTLSLVETQLMENSFQGTLKQNWQQPLEVIAGNLWHWKGSGCLGKITSSQTKAQAKELLKSYY